MPRGGRPVALLLRARRVGRRSYELHGPCTSTSSNASPPTAGRKRCEGSADRSVALGGRRGHGLNTKSKTEDLQAPFEDPIMPPTEEQAAKRATLLKRLAALPEHLRLGVTLPGMRELLSQLPSDAVKKVNAKIPRGARGRAGASGVLQGGASSSTPRTRLSTATSTSYSSPSGPRRTSWPCASGCRSGVRLASVRELCTRVGAPRFLRTI